MIQNLNKLHFSGFSRVRYSLSSMNRRLFLLIGICLALIVTAYFLTIIRIEIDNGKIRESGIEIAKELSRSVSLPLLGENAQSIQSLLSYVAENKDITTVSVFDHRNEIVARVGAGESLPYTKDEGQSISQVLIWESDLTNRKNMVSFSTDITYAGTKIGELYMEIPGAEKSKIRNQFKIAIFSVFLLLIVFVVALRYPNISSGLTKLRGVHRQRPDKLTDIDPVMTDAFVTCPLCGSRKAFSSDVFRHSDLEDVFLFKVPGKDPDTGIHTDSGGIQLRELGKREDLSWLKRQVIIRCSEIIMKLSQ